MLKSMTSSLIVIHDILTYMNNILTIILKLMEAINDIFTYVLSKNSINKNVRMENKCDFDISIN